MKLARLTLLMFFVPVVLNAQSTTGNLEGRIFEASGAAIFGAEISVTSPDLQGVRGMSTDETGFFRFLALPSGKYTVRVRHLSYLPATVENVRVWLGSTTTIADIKLLQTSVQLAEVVVSGQRPLLDPTSTTSGGNLSRESFEILPIERNYRTIASILPEANQSFFGDEVNIAGATGVENRYFINGNDVTDAYRGVGGANLPYNFIREIEVKTGGYEPEYKSSLGGIINVITYSGGNDFSGQAFGFFTSSDFGGEQRLSSTEPPKGKFTQYDFGFTLGGPIVQDRLWFFSAVNPSYRNEDIRIPGLGYYADELGALTFAGKLSWKASDALDVTATILGDPTSEKGVGKYYWGASTAPSVLNPDPLLGDVTTGGYNVLVDARFVVSQNLLLQGSLTWTTNRLKYMPSTNTGSTETPFYDNTKGTQSGGFPERVNVSTSITGGKLCATALFEDHIMKAGIEYREVNLDNSFTTRWITRYDDTTYQAFDASQIGKITNHVPSVFIQDSWLLNKYLRISGGLRWDGLFIVASNGQLVTRVLRQFQPRFGFVFMPGGGESHKVFASFGRYTEDLMLYGSTVYHISGASQVWRNFNHDPRLNPSGGDTVASILTNIAPGVQDLYGQYYDEFALGYERLLAEDFKVTLKGTYRTLREVIDDSEAPIGSGGFYYGNLGEGALSDYPHPKREYLAFEIALEKSWGGNLNVMASYVLSRNYGNYVGLYYQEISGAVPNAGAQFDYLDMYDQNATGLLPNDRTHVVKANASYRFDFGLTCAATFFWETGTPLSEYAGLHGWSGWTRNLVPRGSAGRLPSLLDLNLRFTYCPSLWNDARVRPRFIMDVFHVGSQRQVVKQAQLHYLDTDEKGNPIYPNPGYGLPGKFQPPMSVRLGMEVNF